MMNPRSLTYEKNGGWKTLGKVTFQGGAVKLWGGGEGQMIKTCVLHLTGFEGSIFPSVSMKQINITTCCLLGKKHVYIEGGRTPESSCRGQNAGLHCRHSC